MVFLIHFAKILIDIYIIINIYFLERICQLHTILGWASIKVDLFWIVLFPHNNMRSPDNFDNMKMLTAAQRTGIST